MRFSTAVRLNGSRKMSEMPDPQDGGANRHKRRMQSDF
jgi:hypothetical protein